nr:hypothetical protein CFP56_34855 [Quercus suber]
MTTLHKHTVSAKTVELRRAARQVAEYAVVGAEQLRRSGERCGGHGRLHFGDEAVSSLEQGLELPKCCRTDGSNEMEGRGLKLFCAIRRSHCLIAQGVLDCGSDQERCVGDVTTGVHTVARHFQRVTIALIARIHCDRPCGWGGEERYSEGVELDDNVGSSHDSSTYKVSTVAECFQSMANALIAKIQSDGFIPRLALSVAPNQGLDPRHRPLQGDGLTRTCTVSLPFRGASSGTKLTARESCALTHPFTRSLARSRPHPRSPMNLRSRHSSSLGEVL